MGWVVLGVVLAVVGAFAFLLRGPHERASCPECMCLAAGEGTTAGPKDRGAAVAEGAELDALPAGSVVLLDDGDVAWKRAGGSWKVADLYGGYAGHELGRATVLHVGARRG